MLAMLLLLPVSGSGVEASLNLLAVTDSRGIIVSTKLYEYPSSPILLIEPVQGVASDTRLSIELAWRLARILSGVDGLAVRVVFSSEEVSGASAGSVFAAAMLAAAYGLRLEPLRSGTGVLSPLGLVLPVQGLEQKIDAAKHAGLEAVYTPYQSIKRVEGIKVIPVCTVFDAVGVLSASPITLGPGLVVNTTAVDSSFADEAEEFIAIGRRLGVDVERAVKALNYSYYAAASLAFASIVGSNVTVDQVLEAFGFSSTGKVLAKAAIQLNNFIESIERKGCSELDDLLAAVEASYRLYVAEKASLNKTLEKYALLRALTVFAWLEAANASVTPCVGMDAVRHAKARLADLVETAYNYALTVLGENVKQVVMEDGRTLEEWIRDMRLYDVSGNTVRVLALSLRILEALDELFTLSSLEPAAALKCYRRLVDQLATMLTIRGGAVALPMLFYHYAGILGHQLAAQMYATTASRLLLLTLLTQPSSHTGVVTSGTSLLTPFTLAGVFAVAVSAILTLLASRAGGKEV